MSILPAYPSSADFLVYSPLVIHQLPLAFCGADYGVAPLTLRRYLLSANETEIRMGYPLPTPAFRFHPSMLPSLAKNPCYLDKPLFSLKVPSRIQRDFDDD
jgi:hypothetical protein